MIKILLISLIITTTLLLTGCSDDLIYYAHTNNITTGGGGFTTDQNYELNTTGNPTFETATVDDALYYGLGDFGMGIGFTTYIKLQELNKYSAKIEYKGADDNGEIGMHGDGSRTQGITFDTKNRIMTFYDGILSKTLSQLATDTNTNAETICDDGYFLNGDGTCDELIAKYSDAYVNQVYLTNGGRIYENSTHLIITA